MKLSIDTWVLILALIGTIVAVSCDIASAQSVYCPPPLDGPIGEISLVVPEQRVGPDGSVTMVCCNVIGDEEVCGEALELRYLPEPSLPLLVAAGLVGLWMLRRRT